MCLHPRRFDGAFKLLAQSARSRKPVVDWVRTWKTSEVQGWLRASGLPHLAPVFASISGKVCKPMFAQVDSSPGCCDSPKIPMAVSAVML